MAPTISLEKNHSVTTMFNANGDIVQWYIDICYKNGIENNRPWTDDLFLDLVVLPSGKIIEKDGEELDEAHLKGLIDKKLYDLAWNESRKIKGLMNEGKFEIVKLVNEHRMLLLDALK